MKDFIYFIDNLTWPGIFVFILLVLCGIAGVGEVMGWSW
jgi:hypothetical protein